MTEPTPGQRAYLADAIRDHDLAHERLIDQLGLFIDACQTAIGKPIPDHILHADVVVSVLAQNLIIKCGPAFVRADSNTYLLRVRPLIEAIAAFECTGGIVIGIRETLARSL